MSFSVPFGLGWRDGIPRASKAIHGGVQATTGLPNQAQKELSLADYKAPNGTRVCNKSKIAFIERYRLQFPAFVGVRELST